MRRLLISIMLLSMSSGHASHAGVVPDPPGGPSCIDSKRCRAFRFVHFSSAEKGYVSDGVNLFRTDDGGATWVPVLGERSPTRHQLGQLSIVDHQVFFDFAEDEFLRTKDGGRSFNPIGGDAPSLRHRGARDPVLAPIFFLDAQHGWARGVDAVLRTDDGGATWQPLQLDPEIEPPSMIHMFDAHEGIALSSGRVVATTDGGDNWRVVHPAVAGASLECSADGMCVLGRPSAAAVELSSDRGRTWTASPTGLDAEHDDAVDIVVAGHDDVLIAGAHNDVAQSAGLENLGTDKPVPIRPPGHGLLLRWNGSAWTRREYRELPLLWTVSVVNQTDLWASAGNNGLLRSRDGGRTWDFVPDYYRQSAPGR